MALSVLDPQTGEQICIALLGETFRFYGTEPPTEIIVTAEGVKATFPLNIRQVGKEHLFDLEGRTFIATLESR